MRNDSFAELTGKESIDFNESVKGLGYKYEIQVVSNGFWTPFYGNRNELIENIKEGTHRARFREEVV